MATSTATRLLFPTATALLGISLSSTAAAYSLPRMHCQSPSTSASSFTSYDHQTPSSRLSSFFHFRPFWRKEPPPPPPPPPPAPTALKSTFNPLIYRQISSGSFLGLISGFVVSRFSKTLGLVVGCLLFVLEFLASRGIHVIPYKQLQRFVSRTDLKALVTENVAFKIAFGASFTFAAAPNMYW